MGGASINWPGLIWEFDLDGFLWMIGMKILFAARRARKREESDKLKRDMIGYSDRINPDYVKAPAVASNEENVLGLLLLFPEHRKKVFEEKLIDTEDFYTALNKKRFDYIKSSY